MTVLTVVNSVLRRLRKDEVSTLDATDYSSLVLDFVNESRREVESAWNWSVLRSTVNFNTSASDNTYDLTGTNPDTKVLWVFDATNEAYLKPLGTTWYGDWQDSITTTTGKPSCWDIYGNTAAGLLQMRLYTTPDGIYSINAHCVIPQTDFAAGAEATVIKVPNEPVVLGAYLQAISERGEDVGNLSEVIRERYLLSLGNAIGKDTAHYGEELMWQPR